MINCVLYILIGVKLELVSELKIGAVNHTCECLLARDVRITRRSGIVVGGVASSAKIDSGE